MLLLSLIIINKFVIDVDPMNYLLQLIYPNEMNDAMAFYGTFYQYSCAMLIRERDEKDQNNLIISCAELEVKKI